jgi:hypothetical protein
VEVMGILCCFVSQISAISMLLRHPTTVLHQLYVCLNASGALNTKERRESVCQIVSSLAGNTKLKIIYIPEFGGRSDDECCIYKLCCYATSIRSIYNSNHTLQEIHGPKCSIFLEDCLKLNMNEDKAQVVCNKILKFYYVGNFDVTSFIDYA